MKKEGRRGGRGEGEKGEGREGRKDRQVRLRESNKHYYRVGGCTERWGMRRAGIIQTEATMPRT